MNSSDFEMLRDLLDFFGIKTSDVKICGSIALKLQGLLSHREYHDIDLVVLITKDKLKDYDEVLSFFHRLNVENKHENHYPGEYPYIFYFMGRPINIWLTLKPEKVHSKIKYFNYYIEPAAEIIRHKKRYNREKDLIDLNEIAKLLI